MSHRPIHSDDAEAGTPSAAPAAIDRKAIRRVKRHHDFSTLLIAVAGVPAVILTVLFLSILPFNPQIVARRDFIVYWATAQQLVHHGNPYDASAINEIEKNAGFQGGASYYMRNTPWTLPLALPLSCAGPSATALPWSLAMLGLLVISVRSVRTAIGCSASWLDWFGYCFPPALDCVILGQTSILPLLGFALFIRLHRSRPFAAGAALWLCSIKPHLLLPFAVVLLVWIAVTRSVRILAGAATAFAAGALVTTWIDPSAWSQYIHYMRTSVITREFTPCLGNLLRDSIRPSAEWLAFVPAVVGSVWALVWFWRRRHAWRWDEQGALLVLVSLLAAPFGWIFDHTLAIPAILFAVSRSRSQAVPAVLALLYLLVEIQLVSPLGLHSAVYLWIAPAWLAWYLYARTAGNTRRFAEPVLET